MAKALLASGFLAEELSARAAQDPELRRKATLRTAAVILVGALHVLFVAVLLIVERLPMTLRATPPREVELVLAPNPGTAPRIIEARPNEKKQFQELEPRPITVPPPEIETPPKQQAPVDIMRALGAELACGASHYEYLNPVERKLCHRAPWKLPSERNLAVLPSPQPALGHLTGAEAAARQRAQAPPCPPVLITPCIDKVIYGPNGHDFSDVK
ncbi:MAG: hypothetical protein JOZ55_08745 [Alphaproteobacteria bacterium]|nr:hypothetical protein [Alphaproteobacteria bacterium]